MDKPEYVDQLPESLRKHAELKDGTWKPVEQFAADVDDWAQHVGNSIRIPGPDAGEDAVKTFQDRVMEKIPGLARLPNPEDGAAMTEHFARLGRPEAAEGYKIPEGVELGEAQVAQLRSLAYSSDMTQAQFNKYVNGLSESAKAALNEAVAAHDAGMAKLKADLGAAYDDAIRDIDAFLVVNQTTPPHILEQLRAGTLPADQVRWLHTVVSAVSAEDGEFHKQGDQSKPTLLPPLEARARMEEINARLYDRDNPPGDAEKKILNKRSEALAHMVKGRKPPPDLMAYAN